MPEGSLLFNIKDQRVLITGGTPGMGESTAVAFVETGNVLASLRTGFCMRQVIRPVL